MDGEDHWAHRSDTMRCQTCMYFVVKGPDTKHGAIGRCRRHAPTVQQGWPAVFGRDWCGDHKIDSEKME